MQPADLIEPIAIVTALLSVILTALNRVSSWPVGLVSVVAYGLLFWRIKLYADMGLQAFFLVTGIYGWWAWLHGAADRAPLPIRRLRNREWFAVGGACFPSISGAAWWLGAFTDASLPLWDSTVAGLSVVAQLLLMRRILETWIFWIAVDVLAIGLYAAKGIYATAGLYAVFLCLAIVGLRRWRRELEGA